MEKARKRFVGGTEAEVDALALATDLVRSILTVVVPDLRLHDPASLAALLLGVDTAGAKGLAPGATDGAHWRATNGETFQEADEALRSAGNGAKEGPRRLIGRAASAVLVVR